MKVLLNIPMSIGIVWASTPRTFYWHFLLPLSLALFLGSIAVPLFAITAL